MASLMLRNLPDETHRALRLRAAQHGRSTEAEIRDILEHAVKPAVNLGSALYQIGQQLGGVELDLARDTRGIKAADFS